MEIYYDAQRLRLDSGNGHLVSILDLDWFYICDLGYGDENYLYSLSQGVIISCDLTPGTMPDELQISTEFQNTLTRVLF